VKNRIIFVEMYYKGKKDVEDLERVKRIFDDLQKRL
jgi:hypothetical protein